MKKAITAILIMALVVFAFYNIIGLFSGGESSVVAQLDTMEKSYKLDGIIIRDEIQIIVDTKDGGILDVLASEGEMVSKGKHVATYYDSNIDDKIRSELSSINEKISRLSNSTDNSVAEGMSEKELKEEISRRIDELSYASTERNMSVISAIKDDINELLEDKNTDDEEIMSVADRLEQLRYEKAQIEKDYSGEKLEITAPEHGVFSTKIDGFEDKITPELALNITVSDYKNAKDKKLTADDIRKKGIVCKIVDNSRWYVSLIVDEATAKSFSVDESVVLKFDSESNDAKATVEYISKADEGEYMLTLSSSSYCDYAMKYRFASVTIIKESNKGLKIPLSAIKIRDGKSGVYVKTENTKRYKEVEILSKDDEYAIVKFDNTKANALMLYDEVVINGD